MIIDDFDVPRAFLGPAETDPVAVVDPYAMLALSISPQRLELVSGRDGEIRQRPSRVDLLQKTSGLGPNVSRADLAGAFGLATMKHVFGPTVPEDWHRSI